MNLADCQYLARRLKTLGIDDVIQRLRLWRRHSIDRGILSSNTEAWSLDHVYSERKRWLTGLSGHHLREELNQSIVSSVPKGWITDKWFWDIFVQRYPLEAEQVMEMAKFALGNRFRLFQWKDIQATSPVRWSATMEPGAPEQEWPDQYYADINFYHDNNRPDLDVKWCWELNRFQHLLYLGAAWRMSGEERYAAKAREHIDTWIARVRYPLGIQWASNLEVGLRALSWARCHLLCLNSISWDEAFLETFITSLYLHVRHLEQELTVHHTPGNHLLGEASALFQLSLLYRVFTESVRRVKRSVKIISHLVPKLIHEDGVYAEQSTGYFRFIADLLLPVVHLAQGNGIPISPVVTERLTSGFGFIRTISLASSETPMIGDSDSGVAIGWRLSDYWDFRSSISATGVLLAIPKMNAHIETFPAESFLMCGCDGLDCFEGQKKNLGSRTVEKDLNEPISKNSVSMGHADSVTNPINPPLQKVGEEDLESRYDNDFGTGHNRLVVFPDGGYQVSTDDSVRVILDTGQLGISPGYEHGHADGLSFQMSFQGMPFITDPGTFLYNGDPRWRRYFRGTSAHNTVQVDGQDQSSAIATFRWSGPLNIKLLDPAIGDTWRLIRGRLRNRSVEHQRSILHLLGQGALIVDLIEGPGLHSLEWSLHFGPDWAIKQNADQRFVAISSTEVVDVGLLGFDSGNISVLHKSMEPVGGWYSRLYGSLMPAFAIRTTIVSPLPIATAIAIRPSGKPLSLPSDIPDSVLEGGMLERLRSQGFDLFAQEMPNGPEEFS